MPNDIPSLSEPSSPSGGLLNHDLELSARACSRSKEHEQAQLFAHLITILSFQLELVHVRKSMSKLSSLLT